MPGRLIVKASRRRRQVVLVVEPAPRIHLSAVLRVVPAHLVGVGVPGTVPGGEEAGAHPVDSALCVGKVKLVVAARACVIRGRRVNRLYAIRLRFIMGLWSPIELSCSRKTIIEDR